jgi:hypothetical protein
MNANATTTPSSRVVIQKHPKQDLIIGLAVGLAVLGFVLFAVLSFNKQVGGLGKPGVVTEKLFLPEAETQITIGKDGVKREEIAGKYILRVKLDYTGEIYNVYVDSARYARYKEGDRYMVLQPEGGGKDVFEEAAKELQREKEAGRR